MSTRARNSDPGTSLAAADRVEEFAARHFVLILNALLLGPGTVHDIARTIGIDYVAVSRRVSELAQRGVIKECGRAKSPTGRDCRVWELSQ